jgi:hypothetical protein
MAAFGFTETLANVLNSGIASWKVKRSDDDAYYSLGPLKDGKINLQTVDETDTYQRARVYGYTLEAEAKMLGTDNAACLALLDHLIDLQLTHKITLINGVTLKGDFGFDWDFDTTKDFDGVRFIQVKSSLGEAIPTNLTALLAAPPADGTPNVADVLYTFAPATLVSAGDTTMEIRNLAGDAYETIGNHRGLQLHIRSKSSPKKDHKWRNLNLGVEFDLKVEMLQSSSTELALLDNIIAATGVRATLSDATVFDFGGKIGGVPWKYIHDNDSEDFAIIGIEAKGFMIRSDYAGIIS